MFLLVLKSPGLTLAGGSSRERAERRVAAAISPVISSPAGKVGRIVSVAPPKGYQLPTPCTGSGHLGKGKATRRRTKNKMKALAPPLRY